MSGQMTSQGLGLAWLGSVSDDPGMSFPVRPGAREVDLEAYRKNRYAAWTH